MTHTLNIALHSCVQRACADVRIALQAASFSQLNKAKLGVWEALQHLNSVNEHKVYQRGAADQPQMSLFDHAVQTAELCRLAHPQQDWLHLVGLIHGLGKLMALPRFVCCLTQSCRCSELVRTRMEMHADGCSC